MCHFCHKLKNNLSAPPHRSINCRDSRNNFSSKKNIQSTHSSFPRTVYFSTGPTEQDNKLANPTHTHFCSTCRSNRYHYWDSLGTATIYLRCNICKNYSKVL